MSEEFSVSQRADDQSRRDFSRELMQTFKLMNIDDGISASQALWLHHRARAWSINYSGVAMTVDLINMAYSGDIETTYLALAYGTPDDMSELYHVWSQEKINYLKLEMAKFLGWA